MTDIDPYAILGVSPDASSEQVRGAFRDAVRRAHPDTSAQAASDARVRDVIEAYRLLVDPATRARYDAEHEPRPVVRSEVASADVRSGPATRRPSPNRTQCSECHGFGVSQSDTTCPSCGGHAEITMLEATHARIVRCRTCRGSGRVTVRQSCRACGGTGTRRASRTPPP